MYIDKVQAGEVYREDTGVCRPVLAHIKLHCQQAASELSFRYYSPITYLSTAYIYT